jgi:hypothetical protein
VKYIFLFILLFFSFEASAQNRNSMWCFGDSAGIDFSALNNPAPMVSGMDGRGSCVSICDSVGNFLFYSYTKASQGFYCSQIYNRDDSLMQNGDSLHGEAWYNELMIIPFPGSDSLYYLLSVGVAAGGNNYGLYYSIIDMSMDNGRGIVVQKNIKVNNFVLVDALNGVKHANGRDWWIILKKYDSTNNQFYKFLITPVGISQYNVQSVGGNSTPNAASLVFNKLGDKALFTSYDGLIEILDFDRCSGQFSNALIIEPEILVSPLKQYFGSAFSPDGTKIYVSTNSDTSYIAQYDLNAADIAGSKDTIFQFSNLPGEGGLLRLAPDEKIYMSNAWNDGIHNNYPYPTDSTSYNFINMNLSVINSPDSLGSACDFQPYSFYLGGKRTYWGLPNNPNYDLGPDTNTLCDTILQVEMASMLPASNMNIFYHSGLQVASINASSIAGKHYRLDFFELTGKIVYRESGNISSPFFTNDISCSAFAKGLYIIKFETEKEFLTGKLIVE